MEHIALGTLIIITLMRLVSRYEFYDLKKNRDVCEHEN